MSLTNCGRPSSRSGRGTSDAAVGTRAGDDRETAQSRRWRRLGLPWIDRYTGQSYGISTTADTGGPDVAPVQTYRDVLEDFLHHPEAKSAGPDGRPCNRQTVGLLQRRVVRSLPELTTHVGKESNRLEEVELGFEHNPDEVWTEYVDPGRNPWRTLVLPVLKQIPAKKLAEETGLAVSTVKAARNGHTSPHGRNQKALTRAAAALVRERLQKRGLDPPAHNLACCASFLTFPDEHTDPSAGRPPQAAPRDRHTRAGRTRAHRAAPARYRAPRGESQ